MQLSRCIAPLFVLALGACAAIPDLGTAPTPLSNQDIAASQSLPAGEGVWPVDRWWTAYGDPQLDALMDEGLRGAPDLKAAMARFRKAAGMAQSAGAALAPSVDASLDVKANKQSYNNGFPSDFVPQGWLGQGQAALNVGFDLDLWGRNRAALAAATSEAQAAQIEAAQARLTLTTGIAQAYADLARLHDERAIRAATLDLREATRKLVSDRLKSGLDTRGDMRQADAGVAAARADLGANEESIALRRNQIAALIGAGPDRALTITAPRTATLAARPLPGDVTTALVARRPDVAAALARTQAAASRIKVARADFFPAISLGAMIGFQALGYQTSFSDAGISGQAKPLTDLLFDKGSFIGGVGPAISLPIFHGGALKGQYRSARATFDEAVALYDRTVLDAYREVADAVTSQASLARQIADARAALAASEDAYAIARKRYEGGLSTYLDVLVVEERLLQARQIAAELDSRALNIDIALIRALGGGYAPAPAQYPAAKDPSHG